MNLNFLLVLEFFVNKDAQQRDQELFEKFENDPKFQDIKGELDYGVEHSQGFFHLPDNYDYSYFTKLGNFLRTSTWFLAGNTFYNKKIEKKRNEFKSNLKHFCNPRYLHHEGDVLKIMPVINDTTQNENLKKEYEKNSEAVHSILDNVLKSYKSFFEEKKRIYNKLNYLHTYSIIFVIVVIVIAIAFIISSC